MIHFDLYSMLGGVSWSNCDRKAISNMANAPIPASDYKKTGSIPLNLHFEWIHYQTFAHPFRHEIDYSLRKTSRRILFVWHPRLLISIKSHTPQKDTSEDLSEACQNQGWSFGVYFFNRLECKARPSVLSFNNAIQFPDALHQNNLIQIKELCNTIVRQKFGLIWGNFLKPKLQRNQRCCTTGFCNRTVWWGTRSNGQGDFASFGDNQLPYRI